MVYMVCGDKCKSLVDASVHLNLLAFEDFVLICFAQGVSALLLRDGTATVCGTA